MARVALLIVLGMSAIVTALMPLSFLPAPAQAQVNLDIHWGPQTWGQYCRSDGYGHWWGRDSRYNRACWDNRHYDPHYRPDRYHRW
jgi:hypothetical protein